MREGHIEHEKGRGAVQCARRLADIAGVRQSLALVRVCASRAWRTCVGPAQVHECVWESVMRASGDGGMAMGVAGCSCRPAAVAKGEGRDRRPRGPRRGDLQACAQ